MKAAVQGGGPEPSNMEGILAFTIIEKETPKRDC